MTPNHTVLTPLVASDITGDPSHKPYWWRSRGLAFDWVSELAKSQAADQIMREWAIAMQSQGVGGK